MRFFEQLCRCLSEVVDLIDDTLSFHWILDIVNVDDILVGEVVEEIHGLFCGRSLLLVTEDEVDPVVKIFRDVG